MFYTNRHRFLIEFFLLELNRNWGFRSINECLVKANTTIFCVRFNLTEFPATQNTEYGLSILEQHLHQLGPLTINVAFFQAWVFRPGDASKL